MTAAIDWGIPNWLDATAYPSPIGRGRMLVWAWEFLRRNREYRELWSNKLAEAIFEEGPVENPFDIMVSEEAERFGLFRLIRNPTSEKPPHFKVTGIRQIRAASDRQPFEINLPRHEIGYLFDLTLPLEGQFSRALKDAKALQLFKSKRGDIVFRLPRERSENFVSYLRVLDADEANADNQTIVATLYPNLSNEMPDYRGNARLKDHRQRARELRDSDYRLLAALAIAPGKSREAPRGI